MWRSPRTYAALRPRGAGSAWWGPSLQSPGHHGHRRTLGSEAVQAPTVLSGAVDTPTFDAYMEHVLALSLKKASTTVLDDVRAQRGVLATSTISSALARVISVVVQTPACQCAREQRRIQ